MVLKFFDYQFVKNIPFVNIFEGGKVAEVLLDLPSEASPYPIFRTDESIDNRDA